MLTNKIGQRLELGYNLEPMPFGRLNQQQQQQQQQHKRALLLLIQTAKGRKARQKSC